ncbi:carboxymuconolactone decarboxylase family protein [Streptantibioticus cattleyicolor]|nr:carboxymuconolactone decarboxylase family protein [Streptantibioticus cattleyicolor]CCB71138.1 Carboxymuconolactone decarboxylase [Streptantibioticus cattleyicolor NRRL 8057 = DSM 46488]
MNDDPTNDASGGRLPLLAPDDLDEAQRGLYERLRATRGRAAQRAGYQAVLPDGRLVGPFNAMLRAPGITWPLLEWGQAIAGSGIPADVREVVVLTVAAHWRAEYALYAHTAAAERAGLSGEAVAALRDGVAPPAMRADTDLAHRLTIALVADHHVPPGLYDEAVAAFGTHTLVALVNLIGQYLNTCALLTCFEVPAPAPHG